MAFTSETVKVFLEVLDSGSFSAAARRLKRVPSAISMSISQLEAELDMQLFDRSAREAIPTAAARALEPKARQAQQQLRELQTQALQLHQGLEKRLTLAIAPELLSAAWNGPLATLAQEFPALEVEVRSEPQADALRLLHEGAVQIALVFERPNLDERERFQEFGSELLVAVAAPNYPELKAYGGPIRQEHLINMRQILVGSGNVTKADTRMPLSRKIWLTDSHLATLSLVQAGLGWAWLPKTLIQHLLSAGQLVEIAFENVSNELCLWVDIVWVKDRPLALGAKRYLELMRA
ncbi:MAG TPA: LysR family transcriptional regulator [Pseudomonas sabulinigri]|uniref:HTH lysR-type domain-containing protein n=1 Tax=marine sediment metagenome TaxID=412755 RepID=A0A0F9V2V2_9ZZZZ|nr:LysR family transcriptional regulator [Halopseudomonas sabulinigri]HEC53161.1 LysR family transcriptional regulator [Halopseudomonas sabulinigri]